MRKLVAALSVISFTFGLAIGYHFLKSEKQVIICEADPVSNVESYYSSITSNMKGDTLKVALYNIIKGHDKRDYDSIEQDLKYTDRNWTLSPKEDDENPKMILLYAVCLIKVASTAFGGKALTSHTAYGARQLS